MYLLETGEKAYANLVCKSTCSDYNVAYALTHSSIGIMDLRKGYYNTEMLRYILSCMLAFKAFTREDYGHYH